MTERPERVTKASKHLPNNKQNKNIPHGTKLNIKTAPPFPTDWVIHPVNGTADTPPAHAIADLACGRKVSSISPPQHLGSLAPSDPP
jgi:hypothetical protein